MRIIEATKGEVIKGRDVYPYEIKNDKVHIKLPFYVNLKRLTDILKQKNYFVASDPEEMDSQGWGKWYDAEGYYPYWIYEEDHCHYFAFPPEDYKLVPEPGASPRHIPVLGTRAVEEFFRWLPVLKEAALKGEPVHLRE